MIVLSIHLRNCSKNQILKIVTYLFLQSSLIKPINFFSEGSGQRGQFCVKNTKKYFYLFSSCILLRDLTYSPFNQSHYHFLGPCPFKKTVQDVEAELIGVP